MRRPARCCQHCDNLEEVRVVPMKRKWVSCSSASRVSFNRDLLGQPAKFRAEVIVHELLHLRLPNHGRLLRHCSERICWRTQNEISRYAGILRYARDSTLTLTLSRQSPSPRFSRHRAGEEQAGAGEGQTSARMTDREDDERFMRRRWLAAVRRRRVGWPLMTAARSSRPAVLRLPAELCCQGCKDSAPLRD